MEFSQDNMLWWGWGKTAEPLALPPKATAYIQELLKFELTATPPKKLEDITLKDPALSADFIQAATKISDQLLSVDKYDRVLHAAGKSYPDLIKQRLGLLADAPDAVAYPSSEADLAALLKLCTEHRIAVVPFGGGTSVVGGVNPIRATFDALISVSLRKMSGLVEIDEVAQTARVLPGMRGPELETELGKAGYTLGHHPQSFGFASIGGYVATRSAGQASTGYGRIDELVTGLRLVTPQEVIDLPSLPSSAAGPDVRQLIIGSEGAFGVISEVTLDVKKLPEDSYYEGWMFPDFESGAEALRALKQSDMTPTVARLSDEIETKISLIAGDKGRFKDKLTSFYIKRAGYGDGCLAIVGWEGSSSEVARLQDETAKLLSEFQGRRLGKLAGKAWLKNRYHGPYLRDVLLDQGVFVETLETATSWSNIQHLYESVSDAISEAFKSRGTEPVVYCHISHLYHSGASLYFTFLSKQEVGEEFDQWKAVKTAACEAIVNNGGTITHHHAVGSDHAQWMGAEIGETLLAALRKVKSELDPAGIMNPGKLGL